ncbi:cysteine proteinase [Pilatotrama ljubarskyi]|nr:cysteine proteinase [Pilatotrama ljubarskyi]
MPPKRTRRNSLGPSGLSAGERLKRAKLPGNAAYSAWGWVGTEVTDVSHITDEHRLATCGFSKSSTHPLCPNKYVEKQKTPPTGKLDGSDGQTALEEPADDVIVISDDEEHTCSSKACKHNPYCLNYLGQDKWEDAGKAYETYVKAHDLGQDPNQDSRDGSTPVGLKNLGATCYANAYLQVWFQDLLFRKGVYQCQPAQDAEHTFEESPIFQLQVTFAAMQHSALNTFNPVKLVESLKLRATEQQDAQEFSKLFMAHLDTEFKKQQNPELQSLIANQFEGKQVYNTVCQKCQRRSERDSDFLEIELNLENNATLEDRLSALLEPEILSGDNKYLCQQCDSLQDAKRYTELRELPPVLHFSLLRFVYDISTMERKKSKQAILFPTFIDMEKFLGPAEERKKRGRPHAKESKNLYELRGVLLHKGASAYHGHYEAQVFDVKNQSWYQFNDEEVTKIESLVPKIDTSKKGGKAAKDTKKKNGAAVPKARAPPKKRRRIEDSDSEIEIIESPSQSQKSDGSPSSDGPDYISSKDAYMLVYARVGDRNVSPTPAKTNGHAEPSPSQQPSAAGMEPPPKAMEVVESLNAAHRKACDNYAQREKEAKTRFEQIRDTVMDIYRNWNLRSREEDCVVVSRQGLESWLSHHLTKPKTPKMTPAATPLEDATKKEDVKTTSPASSSTTSISISDVVCAHGKLDPDKAGDMKVLRAAAYTRIAAEDGCLLAPRLIPADVCPICVDRMFREKLYQIEHPRLVTRFDEVAAVEDDVDGYYISKAWLKDWRLAKPKMHVEGEPDRPPDAEEYLRDVVCEHGNLATNVATRRRISAEAYSILREVFPDWKPPSTSAELCPVCEALLHISREDKREYRKQAEEEKARLKHMHDNALNGNTALLEDVPCAVVPSQFVRSWRQWVMRPSELPRPEAVDNSQFICAHGLLTFDPNVSGDLDASMTIIKRSDWDALEELYSAGPLISIENSGGKYAHELAVCADCRIQRRTSFDMTEITIRVLGPKDPIPTADSYSEEPLQPTKPVQTTLLTYSKRQNEGYRKSRRIRQVKEYGKRRKITITKAMTVKDLKVMLNDELGIPVISQRLFYRGQELDDSSATMLSLGVLSNDLLDLKEENEDIDLLSDTDIDVDSTAPGSRKKRAEGQAFGGTLLGGGSSFTYSSVPPSSSPSAVEPIACPACTYENAPADVSCAMCETPLPNA